jgi:hypothetical protein
MSSVDATTQEDIRCFYKCDAPAKAQVIFGIRPFDGRLQGSGGSGAQTFGTKVYINPDVAKNYDDLVDNFPKLLYHELQHVDDFLCTKPQDEAYFNTVGQATCTLCPSPQLTPPAMCAPGSST